MFIRLNKSSARRLRANLAGMGFCDPGVGSVVDGLLREGSDDLAAVVDAIFLGEGFDSAELADRRLWRSVRDMVVAAAHEADV